MSFFVRPSFKYFAGAILGTSIGFFANSLRVDASGDKIHPPHYHWSHNKLWESFDHASIRRGFHVYKNVCASCHSLNLLAYRHLIDVCYTQEEVMAMAAEIEVKDGPDDDGEFFTRPGNIGDKFPNPYENDKQARFINNGALPPDLSVIAKGREGGIDYLFSILTGYREAPAGIQMKGALYFHPYFSGSSIAMVPPLSNNMVEYDDGTEASISQMAKDVCVFMNWAAEPELDDRKKMGIKALILIGVMIIPTLYLKKFSWSIQKTRKLKFW